MDNVQNHTSNSDNSQQVILLTPSLKEEILSSLKWGKVIAIINFIFVFLMILMGISMIVMSNNITSVMEQDEYFTNSITKGVTMFWAIFIFIMAIVLCYFSYLIFTGCKTLQIALVSDIQENYLKGVHRIKLFVQIVTILSVVGVFFSLISAITTLITSIIM